MGYSSELETVTSKWNQDRAQRKPEDEAKKSMDRGPGWRVSDFH